jgi:deferrochelatase/peroxidase EfeB
MPSSVFTAADEADTQALLKTGFDDLYCNYLLLRIADARRARFWLRAQVSAITRFSEVGGGKRLERARQIALTAAGLRKLGLSEDLMAQFAPEFTVSLDADRNRAGRLGDIGVNDPDKWDWGVGQNEPDVLLMVFDGTEAVHASTAQLRASALASGLTEVTTLVSGDMGVKEPFGFRDGVSQPTIDWKGERTPGGAADMDYPNLIATGEFLLGYVNEYGLYTERPLLPRQMPGAADLPAAEDQPELRDLGRNGSYLVLRQLRQNVNRFWRWIHQEAGGSDAAARELGEAMVGRQIDGQPFEALGRRDIPGIKPPKPGDPRNDFVYARDRSGQVCPIGAHVRRANPRTGDYPTGRTSLLKKLFTLLGLSGTAEDDRIASARFHRLLRRGREYGTTLAPAEAARASGDGADAGLFFVCLNANLARQFEFIQGAWLASAKFAGMSNEQDPLLGNREPFPGTQSTDRFTRPDAAGPCRVSRALPQFITVRGGAYFFLPGLRALNWLLADR